MSAPTIQSDVDTEPLLPSTSEEAREAEAEVPKTLAGRIQAYDMAPTSRDRVSLALVLVGLALFLPLTWTLVFTANLSQMGWFAFHPPMQSLGIAALILGITPLQPPPENSKVRQLRFDNHQNVILGLMFPAFTIGTLAMWWNKHVHGAMHFTTWHSWFGLAMVALIVVQAAIGAASVWYGGKAFGGGDKAKKVYKYHRVSGYLLATLALFTAFLGGAQSSWATGRQGYGWLRVMAFWIGLPLIWIGLEARARPSKMKIL